MTPFFSFYSQAISTKGVAEDNVIDLLNTNYQLLNDNYMKNDESKNIIENISPKASVLDDNNYENWWLDAIGATSLEYNGSGVTIAILDTGIYPSSDYNVVMNVEFIAGSTSISDDFGHGTHVAGIVGGNGKSSNGKYTGVAPGVSLINLKIADETGGIVDDDVVDAIQWCIDNGSVDIISMSFGYDFPSVYDKITNALSIATDVYGIICVASAGNSGPEYFTGGSPAAGVDVISVGATDENNNLASFSSVGPTEMIQAFPDVVAPGVNIISVEAQDSYLSETKNYVGDYFNYPGDVDYIPLSGTSMACPMVSGALAILKQAYPYLTPETARIALMEGATRLPDKNDAQYLKSGAGLINIPTSLTYLDNLYNVSSNINNTAKILPDYLPVKPYDLLHFPGDHQQFNLTVLSGMANDLSIELPTIPGVTMTLENSDLHFTDAGVNFTTIDIMIDYNATPGEWNESINLLNNGYINDSIALTLNIRMPEHKILMESYHGLNDLFPEISFYQMGFYDAMNTISELNISIDYLMEYWTPNYSKSNDNSILTEERLSQYDLIVLQNPILPYSPLEISNLINYFNNGGNILFLGTLYQHLCIESINDLFFQLGSGIEINEENIGIEYWQGLGASIINQYAMVDTDNPIFNGVTSFLWVVGTSFTCTNDAESIATVSGKTVTVAYNGSSSGRGKIVAFGDLHWIYTDFSSNSKENHQKLLTNLMEYYFPEKESPFSININIPSEIISNPAFNISIFIKNQTTELPTDSSLLSETNLKVFLENSTHSFPLIMISSANGIAYNDTINLSDYFKKSHIPFWINVSFTIGSEIYNKSLKFLYSDQVKTPQIESFVSNTTLLNKGDSINFNAELSLANCSVEGYMSIYTYSYYNKKQTITRTLSFSNSSNNYFNNSLIFSDDPSGYGIVYIVANSSSDYINSWSPRIIFQIRNNNPKINNNTSSYNGLNFNVATDSEGFKEYVSSQQGSYVNFDVYTNDVEDNNDKIRVSVNLFICFIKENTIYEIEPSIYPTAELAYISGHHTGSFLIPYTMYYNSIEGMKEISTVANINNDYVGLFIVTIFDSEGGSDDYYLLVAIEPGFNLEWVVILIIILVVSVAVGILILLYIKSRRVGRQTGRPSYYQPYYAPSSYEDYDEGSEDYSEQGDFYQQETFLEGGSSCPHCGNYIDVPKKFCPHCGKAIP